MSRMVLLYKNVSILYFLKSILITLAVGIL